MTQEELKAKLTEVFKDESLCSEFMYATDNSDIKYFRETYKEQFAALEGVEIEFLDCYGGEDQGRVYYSVVKFSAGESSVLIKFEGSYASHYGAEYEDWCFVEAKKVEVTKYV